MSAELMKSKFVRRPSTVVCRPSSVVCPSTSVPCATLICVTITKRLVWLLKSVLTSGSCATIVHVCATWLQVTQVWMYSNINITSVQLVELHGYSNRYTSSKSHKLECWAFCRQPCMGHKIQDIVPQGHITINAWNVGPCFKLQMVYSYNRISVHLIVSHASIQNALKL